MSSLEWSTRIKGFIACFVLGIFFSLMGATALILPLHKKVAVFGIFYTLGNITSLLRYLYYTHMLIMHLHNYYYILKREILNNLYLYYQKC